MGGGRVAGRNPVLARGHAVRGDVRPDGAGAHLHDPRVRRQEQREHLLRHHADAAARYVEELLLESISLSLRSLPHD